LKVEEALAIQESAPTLEPLPRKRRKKSANPEKEQTLLRKEVRKAKHAV
jgi:hypothetical protein